jgi:outer membrane biosynthesis protein TonB
MTTLSQKIQERIMTEKLKPKPRWYFRIGKLISSASLATFIVLGSVSVGLIMEIYSNSGLSLVWIFAAIFSLFSVIRNFTRNFYGYRFRFGFVLGISAIVILTFGTISFSTGFSERVRNYIDEKLPDYPSLEIKKLKLKKFESKNETVADINKLEANENNVENEKAEEESSETEKKEERETQEDDNSKKPASNPVGKPGPKKIEEIKGSSVEKKKKKKHKKHKHKHRDEDDDEDDEENNTNPVLNDPPCDDTDNTSMDKMSNTDDGSKDAGNNNGDSETNDDPGDEDNNETNFPTL